MGMFDISKEEIIEAKKSGFFELTDGCRYKMIVNEVDEKDNGSIVLKCLILESETDKKAVGMNYNSYYNSNSFGKSEFIKFIMLFKSTEEIIKGIKPTDLISCVFEGTARANKSKKDPSKTFTNLRDLEACNSGLSNDVPSFEDDIDDKITPEREADLLKEAKEDQEKEDRENTGLF